MSGSDSTADSDQSQDRASTQSGWGGSTDWSTLALAARGNSPAAAGALEQLSRRYWHPVYVYIRRRGYSPCDAEDLTQSFVSFFLNSHLLAELDQSKGRFRSLLLVCLKNFLSNESERARAQKRGGGRPVLSLDETLADERYCAAAPGLSPDALFDRRWALTVLGHALARLEASEMKAGRGVQFERLQVFMTLDGVEDSYSAAGVELGLTRDAVGMALKRLRQRFREALHEEIATTVTRREQVDEELRALKAALRGP